MLRQTALRRAREHRGRPPGSRPGPERRPRRAALAVVAAGALLTVGACGSGAANGPGQDGDATGGGGTHAEQVYAKFAAMSGQARHKALVAAAKKEGSLVLYTSNTDNDDLAAGFEKAYPFIDVRPFRTDSEKVLQRVLQEDSANKTNSDVLDTNKGELDITAKRGLLGVYKSSIRQALQPIARQDHWTATRINSFVVGWNTKKLPHGQPPKSYLELAEPKWKGKISLEAGDYDWYGALYAYLRDKKGMSTDEVNAFFKKLIGNAKVVKGHTVQGQLLSAGQFAVAMSLYKHTVDKDHYDSGAPVEWQPAVQPLFQRPNGQAVMKDAKHPATATLYMDWVLTEGQKQVVSSYRVPVATDVAGEEHPIPEDVETFPVPDDIYVHADKWSKMYDNALRAAP